MRSRKRRSSGGFLGIGAGIAKSDQRKQLEKELAALNKQVADLSAKLAGLARRKSQLEMMLARIE